MIAVLSTEVPSNPLEICNQTENIKFNIHLRKKEYFPNSIPRLSNK